MTKAVLDEFFAYASRWGAMDERLASQHLKDLQADFLAEYERRLEHMGHDPEKYIH
tara:strand:- start:161 stop:328 length:168 start_codon:yes stop_codon:yes gene_type:complete